MARQQFVAHPLRIDSGPLLVTVRECANPLITEEPCYLRDRKVGLTEIVRGGIEAKSIENFTKTQAFRSQPPCPKSGCSCQASAQPRRAMGAGRTSAF